MSTIRVSGDSSGYFDLTVPSAAGTNSIDLSKLPVKDASNIISVDGLKHTNGTSGIAITSGGIVTHTKIPMLKVGVTNSSSLTGTQGKIPFDSFNSAHVFDPEDNMNAFNTSTNTYTIPSGLGGLYHISSHIYTTTSNANQIAVYVNGSREDAIGTDNGTSMMNQGSIVKRFAAGDEIQLWAFYASTVTIQPNMFHTYWQMNFLG